MARKIAYDLNKRKKGNKNDETNRGEKIWVYLMIMKYSNETGYSGFRISGPTLKNTYFILSYLTLTGP